MRDIRSVAVMAAVVGVAARFKGNTARPATGRGADWATAVTVDATKQTANARILTGTAPDGGRCLSLDACRSCQVAGTRLYAPPGRFSSTSFLDAVLFWNTARKRMPMPAFWPPRRGTPR